MKKKIRGILNFHLAKWWKHLCEDNLLVPNRVVAVFLHWCLPLSQVFQSHSMLVPSHEHIKYMVLFCRSPPISVPTRKTTCSQPEAFSSSPVLPYKSSEDLLYVDPDPLGPPRRLPWIPFKACIPNCPLHLADLSEPIWSCLKWKCGGPVKKAPFPF